MSDSIKTYFPSLQGGNDFWGLVGIPQRGSELHDALQEGLSYKVYSKLAELAGVDKKQLAKIAVIAPATLQRRIKAGHFNQDESDRLYRLAEVLDCATNLFEGDAAAAQLWLNQPVKGLGDRRPLDMLATSAETRAVLDLIGRLEHGVVA